MAEILRGRKYPVEDKVMLDVVTRQDQLLHQHAGYDTEGKSFVKPGISYITISTGEGKSPTINTQHPVVTEKKHTVMIKSYLVSPKKNDRDMVVSQLAYLKDGKWVTSKNRILTYNTHPKNGTPVRKSLFNRIQRAVPQTAGTTVPQTDPQQQA